MRTIGIKLIATLIFFSVSAHADTTTTLNSIKESYEKFLTMPLKVTYKREFVKFYGWDNVIEQLPDGKVVVEIPGGTIERHIRAEDPNIDRIERYKKTVSIDLDYNLPVDLTTSSATLWIDGRKFYGEIYGPGRGITYEVYDGATFTQIMGITQQRYKLGFRHTEPRSYDNLPALLVWYAESWRIPEDKIVSIQETADEVIIVDEWQKSSNKLETVLDKNLGFMPRSKKYYVNGVIVDEYNFAGSMKIADIYLPTQICKKTFCQKNVPSLIIYYKDLKWEKMSPEAVAEKLTSTIPPDVIWAKNATD